MFFYRTHERNKTNLSKKQILGMQHILSQQDENSVVFIEL